MISRGGCRPDPRRRGGQLEAVEDEIDACRLHPCLRVATELCGLRTCAIVVLCIRGIALTPMLPSLPFPVSAHAEATSRISPGPQLEEQVG